MSPCSQLGFRAPLERPVLLIVLAALSGCDVPTELPIFDVRWVVPIEETSISVDELLPATGVIISGGNFVVDADTVFLNETLGSLCAACVDSGGFAVPKPVFDTVFTQTGNLATDVVSVQLVSGSISLAIQNDLGFDPIRPAAGSPGTMTVTIYDVDASGRQLSQVTLDGAVLTDSLPDGALTTIPLNFAPGTVSSTIFAEIDLDSPAGDAVVINPNNRLDITVAQGPFSVSSATLDVDSLSVDLDPTNLDVQDIDTSITDRILTGSLILDIQNPFGVGVDLTVDISGLAFTTISKGVTVSSLGTSSVSILYTAAELQRFLGQANVLVSGSGTVLGGQAMVTPTDEVVIEATLDIELEIS
jgi:hypothetical protein